MNQNGKPSPLPAKAGSVTGSAGWDAEESLDTDMVSAICPLCNILLVEANGVSPADMGTADDTAVAMGAKFVSNSWAGSKPPPTRPTAACTSTIPASR